MPEQKPTYEELVESNAKLANHVAGFARMFEDNKRELMAIGWDTCADSLAESVYVDAVPEGVQDLKDANPYRKPLEF